MNKAIDKERDGVVHIVPNNALCIDHKQMARRMVRLARRINRGEFEGLERVVILLDDARAIKPRVYGRPTSNTELVGILTYANHYVMGGQDD